MQIRRVDDMFPEAVLKEVNKLSKAERTHAKLVEIVTPHMEYIDKITGQANDPGYMAYVLEYAQMGRS